MPAIVISMASAKGGSGKTTLAATFASFLTEVGKRVLVIDCDEATHGLTLLHLSDVNEQNNKAKKSNSRSLGVFDEIGEEERLDEKAEYFTTLSVRNGYSLIPATFVFSPKQQMTVERFHERLRIIVRSQRQKYDYIILDAQSGIDVVSEVAVSRSISDEVIIVSEYDPLSAAGIERLKTVMGEELNYSRTWILLNKMLPEFISSFSEFLSVARYLPPIPWTADVVRAYSKRQLALDFTAGNQYTLSIMATLKALVPHADALSIDRWAESKASSLRQPIIDQYRDQEAKLKYIYSQLEQLEDRFRYEKIFAYVGAILSAIGGIFSVLLLSEGKMAIDIISRIEILQRNPVLASGIVAIIFGAISSYVILRSGTSKRNSVNVKLERAKLLRQKEIAEIELNKMESLRAGSLKEIIEKREKIIHGVFVGDP